MLKELANAALPPSEGCLDSLVFGLTVCGHDWQPARGKAALHCPMNLNAPLLRGEEAPISAMIIIRLKSNGKQRQIT